MDINLVPLGAGQEVGRSCILVEAAPHTVMLDCGLHMGYLDAQRLPNFQFAGGADRLLANLKLVVVSHFHLDHIGALPYLTEVLGYRGQIVMTHATKTLAPLVLEDYYEICARRGNALYPLDAIYACLERVTGVHLHQTLTTAIGIRVTPYYAGHVLGAAMFHLQARSVDVFYTGDFNTVADRLLGAAKVPTLAPDVLISESTFAATVREPRRLRERRFLDVVHSAVASGGKVLIPVFALGSAQELSVLVDGFWEQQGLQVPIYMTKGMISKAAALFSTLTDWGSQAMRHRARHYPDGPPVAGGQGSNASGPRNRNPFQSGRFRPWSVNLTHAPGPCVLFATPGMLHAGMSLQVFKEWAPDPRNLVLLPSYCTKGTIGNLLLKRKKTTAGADPAPLRLDRRTEVVVRCKVEYMSFSAHTDSKGVFDLVRHMQPASVVLVHGEGPKMTFLKAQLEGALQLPVHVPANGERVQLSTPSMLPIVLTEACMQAAMAGAGQQIAEAVAEELTSQGEPGRHALEVLCKELGLACEQTSPEALKELIGLLPPDILPHIVQPELEAHACLVALKSEGCSSQDMMLMSEQEANAVTAINRPECSSQDVQHAVERQEAEPWEAEAATAMDRHDGDPAFPLDPISNADTAQRQPTPQVVKDFVKFSAKCIAKWSRQSGHGNMHVVSRGTELQMGDIRARLVSQTDLDWFTEASGAGRPPTTLQEQTWMWQLLWDQTDCKPESIDMCEALLHATKDMQSL